MAGVPEPERANGRFWCFGKGQSILVNKFEKNLKQVESNNKIAQKGKAENNLVKNSSKQQEEKSGGLLRVQQPKPLGSLGRIQESHVRKTWHKKIQPCFRN